MQTEPNSRELLAFRLLFLISATWNFAGAIPGYFNSEAMFMQEFGRELTDPVLAAVYRGAWGTALLYGVGFLIVAIRPMRHSGIVLMGGLGKAFFAFNLYEMYLAGLTSNFALLVIVGDIAFVALFIVYFIWLKQRGQAIIRA